MEFIFKLDFGWCVGGGSWVSCYYEQKGKYTHIEILTLISIETYISPIISPPVKFVGRDFWHLGQAYGTKWGAIGNISGNKLGTWWTMVGNPLRALIGTHWELGGNILGTASTQKVQHYPPSPKWKKKKKKTLGLLVACDNSSIGWKEIFSSSPIWA